MSTSYLQDILSQSSGDSNSSPGLHCLPMSDPAMPVRIKTLHEDAKDNDFEGMTPAERIGMMWQLALDAWAFRDPADAESRLRRDIVRIQRGKV